MKWIDEAWSTPVLFFAYFLLYGLEYFFPLSAKKSRHHWANLGMTCLLIVLNLLFTTATFAVLAWVERSHIGIFNNINVHPLAEVVIGIILLDLWAGYIAHVIFHKFDFLWQMHVIHHSDDLVDVTTTFRQHPFESTIRILFSLSGLVVLGLSAWSYLIYLTLSTLHAQFEHANIRLPARMDRWLQYFVVTPNMHKVHHSKYQHETDSNYSNIFSFWDRLFQTYRKREEYHSIEYGLDYIPDGTTFSFWGLVKYPFRRKKVK